MRVLFGEYGDHQLAAMSMNLAKQFANVAVGLAAQGLSPPKAIARQKSATPVRPAPAVAKNKTNEGDEAELSRVFQHDVKNFRNPKSVSLIHQEYHGEGAYKDVPVVGGLKRLEDKYGTKWRSKKIAGSTGSPAKEGYQKAFSRMQLIVKCVDRQISDGKEKAEVLKEMDELFVKEKCKTLQQFRDCLKKSQILPKQREPQGVESTGQNGPTTPV
jgi:hypothetical protein